MINTTRIAMHKTGISVKHILKTLPVLRCARSNIIYRDYIVFKTTVMHEVFYLDSLSYFICRRFNNYLILKNKKMIIKYHEVLRIRVSTGHAYFMTIAIYVLIAVQSALLN